MKMTEAGIVLTFQKSCEDVSTNERFNDVDAATNENNDITKETETSASELIRETREINNADEVQDANAQEDSAVRDLAVNSNTSCKSLCPSNAQRETKDTDDVQPEELEEAEVLSDTSENVKRQSFHFQKSRKNVLVNALIRRSIKCLNKMHVMEDVHEGCDAQPSSPGHAEQRPEISDVLQLCTENHITTKDAEADLEPSEAEKSAITTIKVEKTEEGDSQVENEATDKGDAVNEAANETEANHVNEDSASSDSNVDGGGTNLKRKLESELAEESPTKKLQLELQRNFFIRDKFLNKYMESLGCNSLDQVQSNTEKILIEIKTLNELARDKEKEWNNIIHLKKIKEELLLRLQRQKQLLLLNNDDFEMQAENVFDNSDDRYQNNSTSCDSKQKSNVQKYNNNSLERNQFLLYNRQKSYNGKTAAQYNLYDMNGQNDYRQNKQRPTLDVKSIIADYRQRHPEAVPRRGRRIRSVLSQNEANDSVGRVGTSGVLNLSNIALGSGAQVRHNTSGIDINRELGLLLNSVDEAQKDSSCRSPCSESLVTHTDPTSFKDMLVQFAKLSQSERQELLHNAVRPPPPYPEVTVHPVLPATTSSSSSLLHGILTKAQSKPESKSTFSPTLARLLTAPEKTTVSSQAPVNQTNVLQGGVVSISDILSSSKARNEITITPVGGQYDLPVKVKQQVEDDEAEDSVDRLVIDEGGEVLDSRSKADNNSDTGDEVPQCQGCNQKPAQFVCAGCGNQWYCSRDCQVSAWDEHSEVCSG